MKRSFPRLAAAVILTLLCVAASAEPIDPYSRSQMGRSGTPPNTSPDANDRATERPYLDACLSGQTTTCQQLEALAAQIKALQTQLKQVSSQIEPVLKRAPFCQSNTVSANGLGATDSCAPYNCNPVSGTCHERCRSVDDCSPPNICTPSGECETLAAANAGH